MKHWKRILTVAAFALILTVVVRSNAAAAAQITGVKQTVATTESVKISWDAALASKHYVIEISDDAVNWYQKKESIDADTWLDKLSPGKSYYVRITGYNDVLHLKPTNETSAPFEIVTAPDVKNITAAQSDAFTNSFSIQVSTDKNSGVNYYQVYIDDVLSGESASPVVNVSGNFLPGSSYWCKTYACRRSASGFVAKGKSSYDHYKTLSEKLGTNSFHITSMYWYINVAYFGVVNSSAVDGYQMQFLNANGKAKKTFTQTSKDFRIENFLEGTFYQYRVRTYVNCGSEKVYSTWSNCRYIGLPKKVTGKKGSTIKINWGKVSGAVKFVVKISTKQNSGYKTAGTVSADKRSITIKKFKNKKIQKSKKYYIRIYAQSKIGNRVVTTELPWEGSC